MGGWGGGGVKFYPYKKKGGGGALHLLKGGGGSETVCSPPPSRHYPCLDGDMSGFTPTKKRGVRQSFSRAEGGVTTSFWVVLTQELLSLSHTELGGGGGAEKGGWPSKVLLSWGVGGGGVGAISRFVSTLTLVNDWSPTIAVSEIKVLFSAPTGCTSPEAARPEISPCTLFICNYNN